MSLVYSATQIPKPSKQVLYCIGGCGSKIEMLTQADDEAIYVCDNCEKKYGKPPMEELPKRIYREV